MPRRKRTAPDPFMLPVEAAKAAQLRYISDAKPGITRHRNGTGFFYRGPDGKRIRDEATLARIRALAIPPAWIDVWIAPAPEGHLQATGRDARKRKQYRYHKRWSQVRDETKYERMVLFARALPRIRKRVEQDLSLPGLPRDKLLATIVKLLETTFIRVGNEWYARTNSSFGLTTLKNRHVDVQGSRIRFKFRGKSRQFHVVQVNDRRLARLVKRSRDLPGQDLFQYLDEAGEAQPIGAEDVNAYIKLIAEQDFTAKDFRTWGGTLIAAQCLALSEAFESNSAGKAAALAAIGIVAEQLGNTVAICRKCYIHPAVLEAFTKEEGFRLWQKQSGGTATEEGLGPEENMLLRYLSAWPGPSQNGLAPGSGAG
jgi:DNA topoisomerase-1